MIATEQPPSPDLSRTFIHAAVVQLVAGQAGLPDAEVSAVAPARVTVSPQAVTADVGAYEWRWPLDEVDSVYHASDGDWTLLAVPGVSDHGVAVSPDDVAELRALIDSYFDRMHRSSDAHARATGVDLVRPAPSQSLIGHEPPSGPPLFRDEPEVGVDTVDDAVVDLRSDAADDILRFGGTPAGAPEPARIPEVTVTDGERPYVRAAEDAAPVGLEAREISAWFGTHQVLDRVSLQMKAGEVTALIGPSGCGKSTFLRILNRMHEMTLGAALAGEVLLDGSDIYDPARKLTDARRRIGMVFQKPNPFPAMSIYDNVVAGFQLTGVKINASEKDDTVEACLRRAGLWNEVKERLRQPGGSLSGGQQQRLCIARALAVRPKVLLMDEPCSALDPTSTRRIEETIAELRDSLTIVIVTHNMQQAARVSGACAFFLAQQGTPGLIIEHGPTSAMFGSPRDPRTEDYVNGRFG